LTFTRVSRELRIDRDTARLLSQATYHQLVLALRELVANAHDGNAATVQLIVDLKKPGAGSITVLDDGDGMDKEEFDREFLTLGHTNKSPRPGGPVARNRFGRPVLGQFGIGFISAIPFANEVLVETKRRDQSTIFGIRIDCGAILRGTGPGEAGSFEFPGWNRSPSPGDPDKFTKVELIDLSRRAYESIDASLKGGWYRYRRRHDEHIGNVERKEYLRNWLSRIVPLGYADVGSSAPLRKALGTLLPEGYVPPSISVDGKQLRRIVAEEQSLDEFELEGSDKSWRARGVLWSPHETIQPVFARGIAVRVGDMSVGEPGYFGLNAMGRVYGKLQHIAGEIQVSGLESSLQLDRQWFYPTPASAEFGEEIRKRIIAFESRLQKKASVMEKFRVLRKAVEATRAPMTTHPRLAPILETPRLLKDLASEATAAGIQVSRAPKDTLEVPKGEQRLTVGDSYGADLLRVRVRTRTITFEVGTGGNQMSTHDLVACLLDSPGNKVTLSGPHVLISNDESAVANLRLFAVLRQAASDGVLRRKQVEVLLEELARTYG
jgi:hypothetical protein